MVKGIIFDFDGVILESVDIKTRAFKEVFKEYPEELDRIVEHHLEHAGISRIDKFKTIYQVFLNKSIDQSEINQLNQDFANFVYREILDCPFVPGAHQFLQLYHKHFKFFLASGTHESELRDIVNRRGLGRFFQGVYGSPKSKADIAKYILQEWTLPASDVMFVGDALADYVGAREVGLPFIGRVPLGEMNPFPLEGVFGIIRNFSELEGMLGFKIGNCVINK
jgi:phosphoglycolate phosphatase-like HAD superfamily hydrolase